MYQLTQVNYKLTWGGVLISIKGSMSSSVGETKN